MSNHEIVVCGVPFGQPEEVEALRLLKEHGATSVQIYVFWRHIEPKVKGQFDWTYYDRQVKLIKDAGLKWVPFLIFGPPYGFPDWWLNDPHHEGMTCLEHGVQGRVESLWNPHWESEVTRLLEAFAAHYLPWNVIESVQPGISGDYGEAIYPAVGNWPGMYHTHHGYWCGDKYAVASFKDAMTKKYGDIAKLNDAWRSKYAAFEDIVPFLKYKSPSRSAYYDLLMWYKASMTDYDEFWMRECQRLFPGVKTYMCTGGCEEPWLGADFAEQSKISAKYGGGIRLTNETNTFSQNYYSTAHTVTACKFYGADMGLEPVGPMIPRGVVTRIFGSAAYGNVQMFHYYGNLIDKKHGMAGFERLKKHIHLIKERKPDMKIAMFWPLDQAWLESAPVSENIKLAMNYVRRQYEVAMVSETLILDGALDNANVLIMLGAEFTRREALMKIGQWIKDGGTLLTDNRTTDIEGDFVAEYDAAMGFTKDSVPCGGHTEVFPRPQKWNKLFTEADACHTGTTWSGISQNAVSILNTKPTVYDQSDNYQTITGDMTASFVHEYGKGRGIFYSGPLDMNPEPDQIFGVYHTAEHLLGDICAAFSGIQPLGTRPEEIARARYDGGMLILKEDEIIIEA